MSAVASSSSTGNLPSSVGVGVASGAATSTSAQLRSATSQHSSVQQTSGEGREGEKMFCLFVFVLLFYYLFVVLLFVSNWQARPSGSDVSSCEYDASPVSFQHDGERLTSDLAFYPLTLHLPPPPPSIAHVHTQL